MGAPESPDAVLESLVGQIADEFTRRHQHGEAPRLEEYTARYPELAELLGEILPAIQAMSPAHHRAETRRASDTPGRSFMAPSDGSPAEAGPANVADYEILGEIGRGGMGVVYKARHRTLGRMVALKMLRSSDAADLARFRGEAQAVASLQHPNIVQIFEVQETAGRPFLALELVDGGSLAEWTQGEPQPPRQAAALVETLARAMAAAHERGLVHRDLKPANVLLSSTDSTDLKKRVGSSSSESVESGKSVDLSCPKISDFGLAKRLDQDLGHTQSGAIVGTPSYMAPEQTVDGANVGPPADLFALGAILYELITGRPPFKGPSVVETLELLRHAEPTPPSQLQPGCPRDLETICLKCLHKEPMRRYAGAAALADDLQRFLNGEPIHARPVGNVERLAKWLRRRPAVAASLGLGAVAALAMVALAVRLMYSWQLEDANQKLGEAIGAKEAALVATQESRRVAEKNHQAADEARTKLDAALERERELHYVHSIALAQREWLANRLDEARRILEACPPDLRHWEWDYLRRQCYVDRLTIRGHGSIAALAVSPNSQLIAASASARRGSVWNLKLWDAASGKLVRELFGHEKSITDVAFSPDGALLASASFDQTVRLWDLKTGRELRKLPGDAAFRRVVFSPDGRTLAASAGPHIRVFDFATGTEQFALAGQGGVVQSLAFSADGARLLSGGSDRLIKLWDLREKKEIASRRAMGAVIDVAFSPQQDQFLSCAIRGAGVTDRSEVCLWDARDHKQPPLLTIPFLSHVAAAAFSANAPHIACAGADGSVLFLDAKTGKTEFVLRGHADAVSQLVFTTDGGRIVTGSADGSIRVWPVRNPEFEVVEQPVLATALACSADGSRIAVSDWVAKDLASPGTPWLRVLTAPPAQATLEVQATKASRALAFAPDQSWLAAAELDSVRLWDLGKLAARGVLPERNVRDLCVSSDGLLLATAAFKQAVNRRPDLAGTDEVKAAPPQPAVAIKIWRVADGRLLHVLPGHTTAAFSPDSQRIAGADDRSVKTWDVATGKELRTFRGPTDPILRVQFVAAGRQLVGFTHRRATIWDADTGDIVATVDGLKGPALATPDGRRIVDLYGRLIKWWDARLGRELLFLTVPEEPQLIPLALSADGRLLAAAGQRRLVLWQATATGMER